MAGYGVGANLLSLGQSAGNDAMSSLGEVAKQETERDVANKQIDRQRKAGNAQLGAAAGAAAGSAFGPWGMLIGGAVGALAPSLFD